MDGFFVNYVQFSQRKPWRVCAAQMETKNTTKEGETYPPNGTSSISVTTGFQWINRG
jgi:hypothetical protein